MKPLPIVHPKDRRGASGKSPTELTIGLLQGFGFECGIVERRIHRRLSLDLFGIVDLIALTPHGMLGVQSTGQDFAGHLKKLTETNATASARWLRTPSTSLILIGWRKIKRKRGGQQTIVAPRIKMIQQGDLLPALIKQNRLDLLQPTAPSIEDPWEVYRDIVEAQSQSAPLPSRDRA